LLERFICRKLEDAPLAPVLEDVGEVDEVEDVVDVVYEADTVTVLGGRLKHELREASTMFATV
jgi:hypothetical protein